MKVLIGFISIIQSAVGIPVSLSLIANGQKVLGFICLAWFCIVLLFVGEWLIAQSKRIKAFTLIELIAVITIMSILLTVTFSSFKTDPSKSDAIRLAGELKLLHAQSMQYDDSTGYEQAFTLDKSQFISEIIESESGLVFEKGNPNKRGYSVKIKYKDLEPIIIYVKSFTGRVTFY